MIRIFTILSALTIVLLLATGGGSYWISQTDIKTVKQENIQILTNSVALSIQSELDILQQSVEKIAQTTAVVMAIENQDSLQMAQTAAKLEKFLPQIMKLRLLPAEVNEVDESTIPFMGNADLIMVQQTLLNSQPATVQGQGEHRHLAMTAVVKSHDRPIGVVLASFEFDFLGHILKQFYLSKGFLELKQGRIALATQGQKSPQDEQEHHDKIPNTAWAVYYWTENYQATNHLGLVLGVVMIPALLACLLFFAGYRRISYILRQDQSSILNAFKDLMAGKNVGSYPITLDEMKSMTANLMQFKRVLDSEDSGLSIEQTETEIDDFFDESNDIDFADINIDFQEETKDFTETQQEIKTRPITLPDTSKTNAFTEPSPFATEKPQDTIFKAYDIRGIVGKTLTKEVVFNLGKAIASEAKEQGVTSIVVGRDGRHSSAALAESLTKGIITTGINILDIGLVPSPVVYFVAHHTEGKSAVVVTGSHNPADYNGLKIVIKGDSLADDKIQALRQRIEDNRYETGEMGSIEQNTRYINEYIGTVADDIHIVRPMKVVVDSGNGSTGEIAPTLLKTIGCEVIELFCEIDGDFPNHHPNPTHPDNMNDLVTAVKHYEADLGVAFDGDGDRLGVVDNKGKIIWPDRFLMLFAKDVLATKPGADIIYDVKCTQHLKTFISQQGGHPLMWKTGHSLIKAKIKQTAAQLAGEMSGHIFFNDRWFGFDDALYASVRLIEILSADTRPSHEVFADLPEGINTPEISLPVAEGENKPLLKQLIALSSHLDNAQIVTLDGLRAEFPDGWGMVRASNTMPELVFRFEGETQEALIRIQQLFKELLIKVNPDLKIPF